MTQRKWIVKEEKRIATHYLRRWQALLEKQENGRLNAAEEVEAKIFFSSLEPINQSDLDLLKVKYFKKTKESKFPTIDSTAEALGITYHECNKRLQDIHLQLGERIIKASNEFESERKEASERVAVRSKYKYGYFNVQFYLRKWYRIQQGINNSDLNDVELIDAKILFLSLNKLDDDKVDILKKKYFHPLTNGHRPKIATISEQIGITLEEFKQQTLDAEDELRTVMREVLEEYQEERSETIARVYRNKNK